MSETDVVLFAVDAEIATPTLNQPDRRHALSVASANRLNVLWEEMDRRDDIRPVILTGAYCGTVCTKVYTSEGAQEAPRTFASKRRLVWQGR